MQPRIDHNVAETVWRGVEKYKRNNHLGRILVDLGSGVERRWGFKSLRPHLRSFLKVDQQPFLVPLMCH